MNIVYIISLPRSGSTLLQRLLLSANGYWTLPETWYLLSKSVVSVSKHGLVESGFRAHKNATASFYNYLGISFTDDFSYTVSTYRDILADKAGASFDTFVEKTPRNILLLNEIYESLGDGDRIIILRRGLREVLASYLDYFDRIPYLKSYKFYKEINHYSKILNTFLSRKDLDKSKVFQVDYSKLVNSPEKVSMKLAAFLKTTLNPNGLGHIEVKKGVLFHGDQKQLDSRKINQKEANRNFLLRRTTEYYYGNKLKSWPIFPIVLLSLVVYVLNPKVFMILRHRNSFVH